MPRSIAAPCLGVFCGLVLGFAATMASAQTVTYACRFNPSDDGWLQSPVTATFDIAGQKAAVLDPIIQDAVGGAIAARFKQRRNGKLEAIWDLGNVRQSRGARKVTWILQIDPSDNSALFRANWSMVGDDARRPPSARGTCQTTDSPNLLG
ncbi:MAG: hypothetical protein OIF47_11810 [Marinibacterium sp.]|nr:hypothetical protein [Marinibacterium sp.]